MKTADIAVTLIDHMGTDLSVVNAARVSFDKASEWEVTEGWFEDELGPYIEELKTLKAGDVKLINYLAKHKHFSPFNHAFMTFRVKAPIFVARQLVKHKFMPWNEISRRYVDSEPEFYFPEVWREKADNVKQGSADTRCEAMYKGVFGMTQAEWVEAQVSQCLEQYKQMLAMGVCAEQARMILPQNTMTEWIWSGSLGAFADMLKLRLDPHTQYESRVVAELIYAEVEKLYPVSIKSLLDNK